MTSLFPRFGHHLWTIRSLFSITLTDLYAQPVYVGWCYLPGSTAFFNCHRQGEALMARRWMIRLISSVVPTRTYHARAALRFLACPPRCFAYGIGGLYPYRLYDLTLPGHPMSYHIIIIVFVVISAFIIVTTIKPSSELWASPDGGWPWKKHPPPPKRARFWDLASSTPIYLLPEDFRKTSIHIRLLLNLVCSGCITTRLFVAFMTAVSSILV